MEIKKHLVTFWQTFFHVRVVIFFILGAGIILLTFLTSNNAVEIAISGVASMFIGIGVNNFSTLETHEKDRRKLKAKMLHLINIMELIQIRIAKLEAGTDHTEKLKEELFHMKQLIASIIHLINEDVLAK